MNGLYPDRYMTWRVAIKSRYWLLDKHWYQALGRYFIADICASMPGVSFEILKRTLTDTTERRTLRRAIFRALV